MMTSRSGICVSHTPQAVNSATADMTMFLILGALRRIHVPYTAIRNGAWRGSSGLGHDPKAKVLGILGMGGIGREVAHRARAFGMRVQYHNRSALPPHLAQAGEYVSFDSLLATSDVLSLNLSLTSNTRHIIAKPQFDMMKTGVVIVNTARGALMDEADLVNALESGKVCLTLP
jgi:glyoxylate reductase